MKASRTRRLTLARQEIVVGNLASGFTSALRDRESRDGAHTISRLAQRIEWFGQPKSQRADHARGHHCDTGIRLFLVYAAWLSHLLKRRIAPQFLLHSYSKHFTDDPDGNGSPEVGGLSVEFIQ